METSNSDRLIPNKGDALVLVDVQNDFLPGGALPVPDGDAVVPVLNHYLDTFTRRGLPVYASRDWHPENHCSFSRQGGPWPPHCVAGTPGAEPPPGLNLPDNAPLIRKATTPGADAYSAFQGTDCEKLLKESGIRRLYVGGLATDYCVLNTVKDAVRLGFEVVVLVDAVRAVNVQPGDGDRALREMRELGCVTATLDRITVVPPAASALLTDLYQLTMLKSYRDHEMNGTAVFEFFVRALPETRNFLMAAGLEQVLEFLETLRFTPQELQWLKDSGRFPSEFVESLTGFRFTGDVDAMPEGTVFFPHEPILRVTAPLPEAQLVETRIINLLQFQTVIASKAARMVLAAPGKMLVDFGLRRAHGAEAGLLAARAGYLAGFAGSATVLAEALFGVPVFGTMAHSYIQAHEHEEEAFLNFARSWPGNTILLVDTYDVEQAACKVAAVAKRLDKEGIAVKGVRLDSGDIARHAVHVRTLLDQEGLNDIKIFASGKLDEDMLQKFTADRVPVDGFGIGTALTVSEDAPSLDCAYKLQEYRGQPRRKRSEGKATWPGRKQVVRIREPNGDWREDRIVLAEETVEGESLLRPVMRGGRRVEPPRSLDTIRAHAAEQLKQLPEPLRSVHVSGSYPVIVSERLRALADSLDAGPH